MDAGQWLGGYRLIRRLGVGGTSTVWLAQDEGDMFVALKLLHPAVAASEDARQRLIRETHTVNSVDSDGVAHVLDVEVDDVQPFIVSEFIDGPTLAEVLRDGPLPPEDAIEYAYQIHSIVAAVHRAGVIHRDIKPGNIILSAAGPVLIDFGIARASEDVTLTAQGFVSATASYASPELLRGVRADADSDWWAWAATVLHMLTGRLPFGSGSTEAVLNRVLHGQADSEGLPGSVARIVRGALAPQPEQRLSSEETLSLLESALEAGVFDDEDATDLLAVTDEVTQTRLFGVDEGASAQPVWVPSPAHERGDSGSVAALASAPAVSAQWILPEDAPAPDAPFGRVAPVQTPFVLLVLVAAAAVLPVFMGVAGVVVSVVGMLIFALVGAVNRGVRRRRVLAGGVRSTDWWLALARSPLTLLGVLVKLLAGWGMGLFLVACAVGGLFYGAPQVLAGRFYVELFSVPGVLLYAQTRPAIAEVTADPYAAGGVWAVVILVFLVVTFFPTGADLREGVALSVRSLLAPWWARAVFVVMMAAVVVVTWMITVNALVVSA